MSNVRSVNRMTGLSGLLDTDSLVTASMKPYKLKVDTQKQNEQVLEWKQEQYRTIMKSANDFYSKYLTVDGSSSLLSTKIYNSVKFTSGNSNVVTATTTSGASIDNYSISVSQLASKASTTLTSTNLTAADKLSFSFSTKDSSGTPTTTSIDDITTTGKTQSQIVSELNTAFSTKGIAATAKISDFSGGILIQSNNMGSDLSFTAKLTSGGASISSQTSTGKNLHASITKADGSVYNISDIENKTTSNTKTIDGVTFNFADTTDANEDSNGKITGGGTPVKLTGTTDVSALKDRITSFINDYDTLLSSINTKLYETRDKNYMPLTDDQRKEMSDTQITQWETKAKTGLLRKDDSLTTIAEGLKSAMQGIFGSTLISSSGLTLESMGIKPVKDYTDKNGLYNIADDNTLTQTLQNNLEAVKELFTKNATATDVSNSGIIVKLADVVNKNVTGLSSTLMLKVGTDSYNTYNSDLAKQITSMKSQISEMEDDLTDRENKLYSKYATLESALSKLQSQQNSLSSYFAGSN
ncbi:flagellar filament capping protein FliD [Clostridium beijerinckii]|jgi:Flagellar capping protein|uniref:Flagellar hook-associated protein 2 n=2 Tax=Clostridium beijerinckii TaxID=1520 RepID=A0AAE2RP71_CLOBE|nr:flagellar filament capping protein FliD [Clostridium beijerinckii]ABR36401.1 flagellar hook-associated 2 domain protein [Clostridium beijerinckii NCIMB 8052]AIU02275.1 flagellar hook-associated 2 domain-containing protein [Clostridium beijerinckii ATCC 35702]MBF7808952.1 flagellar filament capping protein FliD [Clostridium beijerinckii]NRT22533.1 flagellar hook-associated protein 2 [Clostridium beijerinckii]NRT64951.1 flagellar hook-associated protein 2 [Clostridium beijerinckii]